MSKFIRNFSLELSESDLKELIKDAAERETGRKVISISFSISAGYQDRFESSSPCLNNVTVKLGEELKNGSCGYYDDRGRLVAHDPRGPG